MSQLRAYKDNGAIMFDTNLICYGLIRSGYMGYIQSWTRREYRQNNQDPNWGVNWTPVGVYADPSFTDQLHGFTVWNAISPIVFIVGPGCLNGSQNNADGSITFFYSNASTSTKFFCFDLMGDFFGGSPYLKTYDQGGRITFNSLQPPLNIVGAFQAPGPPGTTDQFGRWQNTYNGGRFEVVPPSGPASPYRRKKAICTYDVNFGNGVEYAAFLPWSRSCTFNDLNNFNGIYDFSQYGAQEGAYGRVGGFSFMFGASAGTTNAKPNNAGYSSPFSIQNLPTDRYPQALLIITNNLPFPFN